MKLLVTGKTGQVGTALAKLVKEGKIPAVFTNREEYTIDQPDQLNDLLRREKPNVLIHTAAYTQVDQAESDADTAWAINATWPGQIAAICAYHGTPMIHLSTDFVFSGQKNRPYTEEDLPHPISVYGKSKLAGEMAVRANIHHHIILRVGWVYSETGKNFCKTMLNLAKEKELLSVVKDQTGTPTTARDVAKTVLHMAKAVHKNNAEFGLFHFAPQGHTTWYGFAKEIINEAALSGASIKTQKIVPIATADYPTPAKRPLYSVLDTSKIKRAYGISGSPWKEGVKKTVARLVDAS